MSDSVTRRTPARARAGQRSRGAGARGVPADQARETSNITAQIPYDDWRHFQIKLLLDRRTMQEWMVAKVRDLNKQSLADLRPQSFERVARTGETKQVIARLPAEELRSLRIRLAQMGIPMSTWLLREIRKYTKDLDITKLKV